MPSQQVASVRQLQEPPGGGGNELTEFVGRLLHLPDEVNP